MKPEHLEYVQGELAKGLTPDSVKQVLRNNGYSEQLIVEIFSAVTPGVLSENGVPQPVLKQKNRSSVLKVVFIIVGIIVVIIALIGIVLASMGSSSLGDARDKGRDAADMSILQSFRAQAEIYYDGNSGSYEGVCQEFVLPDSDCRDGLDSYRVYTKLNSGSLYCVDSLGSSDIIDQEPPLTSCR